MPAPKGNTYFKNRKSSGVKSLYKPEYDPQVYNMALLGLTDAEMAETLGISQKTFDNWKKDHKGFLLSIKRGKMTADGYVAENLYKRAIGYTYDEVRFEKIGSRTIEGTDLKEDIYKKTVTTKEMAPDPTAAIFWLKNRQAKQWRDKQLTEHTGKDGSPLFPDIRIEVIDNSDKVDHEDPDGI